MNEVTVTQTAPVASQEDMEKIEKLMAELAQQADRPEGYVQSKDQTQTDGQEHKPN